MIAETHKLKQNCLQRKISHPPPPPSRKIMVCPKPYKCNSSAEFSCNVVNFTTKFVNLAIILTDKKKGRTCLKVKEEEN